MVTDRAYRRFPRLVIAGTHSGVGKTSIVLGILGALRGRGMHVQSFKVGPDFIDPMYHREVTGAPSYNLDAWLMGSLSELDRYEEQIRGVTRESMRQMARRYFDETRRVEGIVRGKA